MFYYGLLLIPRPSPLTESQSYLSRSWTCNPTASVSWGTYIYMAFFLFILCVCASIFILCWCLLLLETVHLSFECLSYWTRSSPIDQAGWPASHGPSCLWIPALRLQTRVTITSGFYVGAEALDSGPHAHSRLSMDWMITQPFLFH